VIEEKEEIKKNGKNLSRFNDVPEILAK